MAHSSFWRSTWCSTFVWVTEADDALKVGQGGEESMTVREAFAKAGHPVEDGWAILWFGVQWNLRTGGEAGPIYRKVFGNDYTGSAIKFEWEACDSVIPFNFRLSPDLSNLPAIDAYDALPKCVREVLDAAKEEAV